MKKEMKLKYDKLQIKLDINLKKIKEWEFKKTTFSKLFKKEVEYEVSDIIYADVIINAYDVLYKHYRKEYDKLLADFMKNNKELDSKFEKLVEKTIDIIIKMLIILEESSSKSDNKKYDKLEKIANKISYDINLEFEPNQSSNIQEINKMDRDFFYCDFE